jgi:DNA polymerase III subunit gamma/tau
VSLYTAHRPATIQKMKGDFSAIEKMLKLPDHNHVFLFTGPSGVGKTTLARIVANIVRADPLDIDEINGALTNGIDDIRGWLGDLMICPMGRAHVYIIDEFHKITVPAQNALLKPLEDTPDHVYFILCSSEPKHIIKAIRTRASTFEFPPLTSEQLYDIMREIKKEEGYTIDKNLLLDIAEKAEGSARTAINMLECVATLSPEEQEESVGLMNGGTDDTEVIDLCRSLYSKMPWKDIRTILSSLKDGGKEPESIRRAILGYGQALLLSDKNSDIVAGVMMDFINPVYDSGFPGLTLACYTAWAKNIRGF